MSFPESLWKEGRKVSTLVTVLVGEEVAATVLPCWGMMAYLCKGGIGVTFVLLDVFTVQFLYPYIVTGNMMVWITFTLVSSEWIPFFLFDCYLFVFVCPDNISDFNPQFF